MSKLVKDQQLVNDQWQLVEKDSTIDLDSIADSDFLLLPLGKWLSSADDFSQKKNIGVWLDSDEAPEPLAGFCKSIPLIAINFPVFSDGRGYSYARTLREHYHYEGELRAIGDILRDQMHFYQRCGFSSFAIRDDRDSSSAIEGLNDFSVSYQAAYDTPTPLFRRR